VRWPLIASGLVGVLAWVATGRPVAADPTADAEAKWKHGSALYDLGKYKEAIVDFEAAYELDPNPAYLFAIAQANRFDHNYARAIELFRRYLDLQPDDPKRTEILQAIAELDRARIAQEAADKAAADQAAAHKAEQDRVAAERAKAELEKAAADKAEQDRLAAQQAAADAKHLRIAVDVGTNVLFLQGLEDGPRSPALGGRIGVTYTRRVGSFVLDVGGSWQLTTIPYDEMKNDGTTRGSSVFFTQLHVVGAASHTIAGPVWGRLGIGLGVAGFGNLKQGNPVTPDMKGDSDIRMPCARIDTVLGYRYSPTLDFVLGVASASIAPRNARLVDGLRRVTTLEGAYLGIYVKI